MNQNSYIGHNSQICGVEESILTRGKGKGMTLLNVRNGKGLNLTFSADRAMDISRVEYLGFNIGYFSPCGYVAPQFYDKDGTGFLKSFTAGFLTTCGLTAVGSPCVDEGETLPLHGTISNTPSENYYYTEDENEIKISATVRDAAIFNRKLLLCRTYTISKSENLIKIDDTVKNIGGETAPCMLLYHMNMGYPLLSENAVVNIPHTSVRARNAHAQEDIENSLVMEKPQSGYEERCYYYDVKAKNTTAAVGIFNPDIERGLVISFDKTSLDRFTQWKMMGEGEYVLGLEPGNCTPDGRDINRRDGILKFIDPNEEYKTHLEIKFTQNTEDIQCL